MTEHTRQFAMLVAAAAASAGVAMSCANERDIATPATIVTWREDVSPKIGPVCATAGCHAGSAAAGGYDLTSYLGALGTGGDAVANAIAGDPESLILGKLDGAQLDDLHVPYRDLAALLRTWVVDSRLAYRTSRIHEPGLLNPADPQFHGTELERRAWDFAVCAKCHGADFTGGTAKAACTACHAGGPTACTTCHRDDGALRAVGGNVGAHPIHHQVGKLDCSECHIKPTAWNDEGHIRRGGKVDPAPAEVTFGPRAALTLIAGDRKGPPTFADGTCTNVYCHGDALHAGGGTTPTPRWDDPAPAGACNRCHGAPPPSHAQDQCAGCHPASAPHIDGVVQIGRTTGCDGCHGTAASPAPPNDLSGNLYTTALGVGAHQAHLQAPSRLRGPIPCATCHRVPTALMDVGHIDSPLPAEVDASLGWDRVTATCGTASCHGPARPVWTQQGGAGCGTCHGIPPVNPSHTPGTPLTACVTCHPRTIDASGNFVFTAGATLHINGTVDVF